mmetsp:Transcript_10537/g.23936  ORF Transcript_10537/g.23936 Transcript_10537/m.23936 type:complete len:117 (-) Transcript_10537:37-387(-)
MPPVLWFGSSELEKRGGRTAHTHTQPTTTQAHRGLRDGSGLCCAPLAGLGTNTQTARSARHERERATNKNLEPPLLHFIWLQPRNISHHNKRTNELHTHTHTPHQKEKHVTIAYYY